MLYSYRMRSQRLLLGFRVSDIFAPTETEIFDVEFRKLCLPERVCVLPESPFAFVYNKKD
jgi:hypothetical protein